MPHIRKNRVIRIFISSTFADMDVERNLLQSKIIPQLRRYCSSKGWQFECVDLRWGISQKAQEQQKTIEICLNEIRHCRSISPKPNFIVLLGQRYGWVPEADKDPDGMSMTEMEIYEGLLSHEELSQNTLIYNRLLSNVPDNLYKDYIEETALDKLENLKERLFAFVPSTAVYNEEVSYDHYHTNQFADVFISEMTHRLKSLIDSEIKEHSAMDDQFVEECFQSDLFAEHQSGKHMDLVARIDASKSKIVVINTVDERKRLEILSEYASIHEGECFFSSLGRSWMSSDGTGLIRSILKKYGIRFFPSDSYKKLVARFRHMLSNPQYHNVIPPRFLILDSFDNLLATDQFLFFSWFDSSHADLKVLLSLSDLSYLSHLHQSDYEVVGVHPDVYRDYSDFKADLDWICSPENNSRKFVSLATGLMCYSHSGVTEDEILEIAAMDEDFFQEFLNSSKHELPVIDNALQRIPYSIWSILYYHMGHMLVMRNSLGASTYTFDNDDYKRYAQQYFGNEQKNVIYDLIIRYFNTSEAYASVRALVELPNAYLATENHQALYILLKDCSFCQRLVSEGLVEYLIQWIISLKYNLLPDDDAMEYLDSLYAFLLKNIDSLCKYSKYDKTFFSRKFNAYRTSSLSFVSTKYIQKAVYMRSCTYASRIFGGLALIVSYPHEGESLCEIIDVASNSLIAMRYMSVSEIIKGRCSYHGDFKHSYLNVSESIAYIYDTHGYLNIWNYATNELERIPFDCDGRLPFDDSEEFALPDDFHLESDEHIISCGRVDSDSFYVVTGYSLHLITLCPNNS